MRPHRVAEVRAFVVSGGGADYHDQGEGHWIDGQIATPMSRYPEYRATRSSTLKKLVLEQDQFWTSEVTIEALRQHARVKEVPVTFLTRRGGESKKPKSLRYGWHFTKAIAKTWLR